MQNHHDEGISALLRAFENATEVYDAFTSEIIRGYVPGPEQDTLRQRLNELSAEFEANVAAILGGGVNASELELLGTVVRNASFLEHGLRSAVAALLGSKYAAVAVAGQSTGNLIELAKALVVVREDVTIAQADELRALLKSARDAFEKRNRFAHSMWGTAADGSSVTVSSKLRKWELMIDPVSLGDLAELNRELTTLAHKLVTWTMTTLRNDFSNEIQLRWEQYVGKIPREEREALIAGRAQEILYRGSTVHPDELPSPDAGAEQ